jgi:hypothetical protein
MALLDFVKNRQTQQQSLGPEAKPETATEMYASASLAVIGALAAFGLARRRMSTVTL